VVPNVFTIALSSEDFDRLTMYADTLQTELAGLAREYAEEQRYTFLGAVNVTMTLDESLDTGLFRVTSEARPATTSTGGSSASARLIAAGGEYPLRRGVTRLGRGVDADIRIDDAGVSRHHADVIVGTDTVLRDLGSTNGTYVNGVQVSETLLRDGATIRIGSTTLTYRSGP
jgi:hypothetical protein